MLMFLIGLLAGGTLGALAMCLCIAAGNADRAEERDLSGRKTGSDN